MIKLGLLFRLGNKDVIATKNPSNYVAWGYIVNVCAQKISFVFYWMK